MNDQTVRDLLHEAADDIEPGDRLDAIRAATASTSGGRRTHRGWWAAGGAGLLAASIATAFALTTGGAPQSGETDVAGPATTSASDGGAQVVPVYFVGETPMGPRLYREFRTTTSPGATYALGAALRGDALDPDYRSWWPVGTAIDVVTLDADLITVSLRAAARERPAGMSATDADLAIEQLVRTAQGVVGQGRLPVRLLIDGQPAGAILGVATASPLGNAPDADVLAPVSLSDPAEGLEVDNDDGQLTVRGRAWSSDGVVTTRVKRWEGTAVLGQKSVRLTPSGNGLSPFTTSFDMSDAPAGEYDVISEVQNADGTLTTDTRRITVFD